MSEAEMERLYSADHVPSGRRRGPGVGRTARLERRYRRLLAWFPRDHRVEHAEEMLGVLMAGAAEDQSRPRADESANLIAAGVLVRLRRAVGCFGAPRWRDALAVVSVVAPMLLITLFAEEWDPRGLVFYFHMPVFAREPLAWWLPYQAGEIVFVVGWAAVLALAALGRRTSAMLVAAVFTVGQAAAMLVLGGGPWWLGAARAPEEIYLGTLVVAALACSDGARRGVRILGRRWTALIAAGLLAWVAVHQIAVSWPIGVLRPLAAVPLEGWTTVAGLVIGAAVAAACLRSPVGRRAVVLLAPAASPGAVVWVARALYGDATFRSFQLLNESIWIAYLVLAVLIAALAVAGGGKRRARRAAAGPGAGELA